MSKYILKYTRDERVKYISHLDFIRMFHRTVRRSGVNFLFSEGFNPHPVMTVAMPLSVGVTSGGEYMKVGFEDEFTPEEIMKKINSAFPPGFKITQIHKLTGKEIDLTKIEYADYTVITELKPGSRYCEPEAVLSQSSLVVMKKSKSGEKPSDIRPHIQSLSVSDKTDNTVTYKMRLSCSNSYNLKPETVISAMETICDSFNVAFLCIHRDKLVLPGNERN
ncbi:MAG: DUF2344 domain-containing protein [Clostridia bacterium]|nr:DUF2344 domain-containing protein [Clostridia bacterium]